MCLFAISLLGSILPVIASLAPSDPAAAAFATPTFVQAASGSGPSTNVASIAATWTTQNITAGNVMVAFVDYSGSATGTVTVADTAGNTWTQIGSTYKFVADNQWHAAFWSPVTTGGGKPTVTATLSTAVSARAIDILEYSGVDTSNPVDVTPSFNSGSSMAMDSGNITTVTSNTLLLSYGDSGSNSSRTTTIGSGFTERVQATRDTFNTNGVRVGDKVVTSTGTYNGTWTVTGGNVDWAAGIVALKATSTWYAGGTGTYGYKKLLTVDYTKVGGSTLTNFPVLVSFTDADLKTTANGGKVTNSSGYDIIFVANDDATKLDHEIESYNATTGAITMWVRIPSLSGSANTTFYFYFGNSSVTTSQENATGVWDSNFKAVYHMDTDPSVACASTNKVCDSTANANNGTSSGMTSANLVTGQLGKGISFNGSSSYFQVPNSTSLQTSTNMTFSSWVYWNGAASSYDTLFEKGSNDTSDSYGLHFHTSDGANTFEFNDSAGTIRDYQQSTGTMLAQAGWKFVTATVDDTNNLMKFYINGTQVYSTALSQSLNSTYTQALYIGRQNKTGADQWWNGNIDELRIEALARPAGWITAEYNNQSSPSTFISVGALTSSGHWYPGGTGSYGYKKLLTIDYTKVGGSTLTNYPVLVSFTDPDLKTTANSGKVTNTNGYDIIFVANDDTTKLDHEIESYNATTGAIVMWVRMPTLSASANTTFYIYFGNSTISTSQENKTGVWDSNYVGVWHLKEAGNGTAGEYKDSTSNANNGQGGSGTASKTPASVAAKVGQGADFDGVDDIINAGSAASLDDLNTMTMEAWVYLDTYGGGTYGRISNKTASNGTTGHYITVSDDGVDIKDLQINRSRATTNTYMRTIDNSLPAAGWHHTVIAMNGTTATKAYIDGVETAYNGNQTGSGLFSSGSDATFNLTFGNRSDGTRAFDGRIDEMRYSNVARSAGWFAADYNSQSSPSTFMSVGATQAPFDQSGYRWYTNNNAVQPTAALAAEDTAPTVTLATGLRLRMQIGAAGADLAASARAFSLQYASSTSGPWTTVTGASASWRYNNATPADDSALTAALLTGTTVNETYTEADPSAVNPNAITAGGFGEWDFSLSAVSGIAEGTYYFQMVESGGSAFTAYSQYAAINVNTHLTQGAYRFFTNNNGTSVGAALAAQDTAISSPNQGTPFRLRIAGLASNYSLTAGYSSYKLQSAARSGTCDTAFSGEMYSDVAANSGAIRFYDNSTPADGATATSNASDPTTGVTRVMQTYEEANDAPTVATVPTGQEGIWDFSLVDFSATSGSVYCFRMVRSDSSTLNVYGVIPQITTVNNTAPNAPTNLAQTKTDTTGIPGTNRYNFDASLQSWLGDTTGGTTYALDTTDKRTGAGSMKSTIAAADTSAYSEIAMTATDMRAAGPVFSVWVYTPSGTTGTPGGNISVIGSGQTINGTWTALDKGNWTLFTVTAPPDVLASITKISVYADTFSSAGSKQVNFDDVQQGNGIWTNETSVRFTAATSDVDASDTNQLCIEAQPVGTAFTNTEQSCGSLVTQGNTAVHTLTSLTNGSQYHWQARTKDASGSYSSWVAYGANKDTTTASADFGIDSSNPTAGSVKDGPTQGVEAGYNNGALDTLSANWTGFSDGSSGIARYEYSIGTSAGDTTTSGGWISVSNSTTEVTKTGLTLRTSQMYYFNVRAVDIAGNTVAYVSTNGQMVAPTLTFTKSTNVIDFAKPTLGNGFAPPAKTVDITVQTNGYSGYVVRQYASALLTDGSKTVPFYAGTYASPTVWSGTGFGYTTSDTAIQGAGNLFNTATRYAGLTTSAPGDIVADHTSSITGVPANDSYTLTYKLVAAANQSSGSYATNVRLDVVASF